MKKSDSMLELMTKFSDINKTKVTTKKIQSGLLGFWIWLIRATSMLLLIVQSSFLGKDFLLFTIASVVLSKGVLSSLPAFRKQNLDIKIIVQWLFFCSLTSFMAWLLTFKNIDDKFEDFATSFIATAIQVALIVVFVQLLKISITKFRQRLQRKKQQRLDSQASQAKKAS